MRSHESLGVHFTVGITNLFIEGNPDGIFIPGNSLMIALEDNSPLAIEDGSILITEG